MKFQIKVYQQKNIPNILNEAVVFYDKAGYYEISRIKKSFVNSIALGVAFDEDDKIIGIARTIGDKARFTTIVGLYVDPKYRKLGVGTKLLQRLAKSAGTFYINLTTDPSSPWLENFYKKAGFTLSRGEKVFKWKR